MVTSSRETLLINNTRFDSRYDSEWNGYCQGRTGLDSYGHWLVPICPLKLQNFESELNITVWWWDMTSVGIYNQITIKYHYHHPCHVSKDISHGEIPSCYELHSFHIHEGSFPVSTCIVLCKYYLSLQAFQFIHHFCHFDIYIYIP